MNKFDNFFQFFENKDRFIDKLDLEEDQKSILKDFFKKHPNYESKVDWNKKDLTWEDFQSILELEGKSKSQAKKKGIEGLIEGKDYKILAQNEDYIVYYPLTHLGSQILASSKVAPYGEAKWCISMNEETYWNRYTDAGTDFFFFFLIKKENGEEVEQKFAIARMDPQADPYTDAWDYAHAVNNVDEDDPSTWQASEPKFNFFDQYDTQYEDWTVAPFFEDLCKIIKRTPNYIQETTYSTEKQKNFFITYKHKNIISKIEVLPEAKNTVLKIKEGIKVFGIKNNPVFTGSTIMADINKNPFELEFPDTLEEISSLAFGGSGFVKITLPKNIKKIGSNIFGIWGSKWGMSASFPTVIFSGVPGALDINFDAFMAYKYNNGQTVHINSAVQWPGTIKEFVSCLYRGDTFVNSCLTDGVFDFSKLGIMAVNATDGTFSKYRVLPSLKDLL